MSGLPVWLPGVFALILGAVIGSFLNAVIYRMPRGISVGNPRRSFCPDCKASLPWFVNIPVLSWLALRGRCKFCGGKISARYPAVELLAAVLFYALWQVHGLPLAPVYAAFVAMLIAATFIDIDFLIIPDELTLGGIAAGVVFSVLLPEMMGGGVWWEAGLASLLGAATGFAILWVVVELGKLAFGKKRRKFGLAKPFVWRRDDDTAFFEFEGGERLAWEEIFSRETDELIVQCASIGEARATGDEAGAPAWMSSSTPTRLVFRYDRVRLGGREYALDDLAEFSGVVQSMVIPREAMGFGDVKFLAAIGAFLGWQAVLFCIFVSSIVGCLAGLASIAIRGKAAGGILPFGPFLALGAAAWTLGGSAIWHWYFSRF